MPDTRLNPERSSGQPDSNITMKSYLALALALALAGVTICQRASVVVMCAPDAAPVEIVVAADGSGQFKTVQQAIMSVPSATAANPVVIRIKPGLYKELIYIQR